MKHPPIKLIVGLLTILAGHSLCPALQAADYTAAANHFAELFLLEKKHEPADLAPFLKKQGIGDGPIAKACEAAVKRAEKLVAAGATPGKPAFALLMGSPSPVATTRSEEPTPKEDEEEKPDPTGQGSGTKTASVWPRKAKAGDNVFFHSGVRVLTPYTIDATTKKISSSSTQTGGFMEVVASNLWTWQPEYMAQSRDAFERDPLSARQRNEHADTSVLPDYAWQSLMHWDNYDEGWDYLGRLSFEFGADQELTAATITGSGDVSAELAFTKNLARGWTPNGAWSVGPGASIGAVTDRAARIVHQSLYTGVNTAASFMVGDKNRLALLRIGFGWAKVDGVRYDETATDPDVIVFNGSVPDYENKWRPAAEAELWWPLADAGHVTAGARIYGDNKPDQWTLYLGVTLAIDKALAALNPTKTEKPKE